MRLAELVKVACQSLVREADIQSSELRREHDADAVAYRRKRDLEIAELNHQRNWQAPIIQLPVEVFSNILSISLLNSSHRHFERLRELALVAKYWRDVVTSTPRLWAVVSDRMSTVEVDLVLKKSKNVALDVAFTDY